MWITAFLNFVLYVPIAIVIICDVTVVVRGWHVRFTKNPNSYYDEGRLEKRTAIKMLV